MSDPAESPRGQGDDAPPKRSEIRLIEQALRQDWPIAPDVKTRLLQRLINLVDVDPDDEAMRGGAGDPMVPPASPPSARTVIAASRAIAAFCKLTLQQQAQDLKAREIERRQEADEPIKRDVQSLRDFLAGLESGEPAEDPQAG